MTTGSLRFGWSPIATLLAESRFSDLIEEQWAELSFEHNPPQPDYERALQYERSGFLKIWTARRRGRIVGFIQWTFVSPIGYPEETWAVDAGWYFDANERNAWRALMMWRTAEDALRTLGVSVARGHENSKRPLGAFFSRLGWTAIATVHEKKLA